MLKDILEDILKVEDVLFVVKSNAATSEIRSNSLGIRQKEKWITIGENDGPAHMHIDATKIKKAKFVTERKPERTSFSLQLFDDTNQRVAAAFFTKMYDEQKNLKNSRKQLFDDLEKKYGTEILY